MISLEIFKLHKFMPLRSKLGGGVEGNGLGKNNTILLMRKLREINSLLLGSEEKPILIPISSHSANYSAGRKAILGRKNRGKRQTKSLEISLSLWLN